MENKMTFGRLLRMERKRQGLTAEMLGKKMGISGSLVARYERDAENPKIETVERFAAALGVPVPCIYPVKSDSIAINFDYWEPCENCETQWCGTCEINDPWKESCHRCFMTAGSYPNYTSMKFCPECGRPLTRDAREVLDRKIRGCLHG